MLYKICKICFKKLYFPLTVLFVKTMIEVPKKKTGFLLDKHSPSNQQMDTQLFISIQPNP